LWDAPEWVNTITPEECWAETEILRRHDLESRSKSLCRPLGEETLVGVSCWSGHGEQLSLINRGPM